MFKATLTGLIALTSAVQGSSFIINNTGEGATVTSTATTPVIDPNWTINGAPAYVTDNSGLPFNNWMKDNLPTYAWISPQPSYVISSSSPGGGADPGGIYVFQTTFNLTGFDPSTANIYFQFAVDDAVTDVTFNGIDTGIFGGADDLLGTHYQFNSGFLPGLNTITFYVWNNPQYTFGNPVGLTVDFLSATADPINSGDPSGAPEPATFMLLGAGLLGLALLKQKR